MASVRPPNQQPCSESVRFGVAIMDLIRSEKRAPTVVELHEMFHTAHHGVIVPTGFADLAIAYRNRIAVILGDGTATAVQMRTVRFVDAVTKCVDQPL